MTATRGDRPWAAAQIGMVVDARSVQETREGLMQETRERLTLAVHRATRKNLRAEKGPVRLPAALFIPPHLHGYACRLSVKSDKRWV